MKVLKNMYQNIFPKKGCKPQKVSEYDQAIPQSQTADKHVGPR